MKFKPGDRVRLSDTCLDFLYPKEDPMYIYASQARGTICRYHPDFEDPQYEVVWDDPHRLNRFIYAISLTKVENENPI